ncbi:hypothetical protein BC628DRAFT_31511 [Trametes gibbosa]|nr:hypothetical protein BC628DRAFT_1202656 [Trametes gibbosa]KAI0833558.1 hypothetical protein BC628DRAFT_31511 [Trametes gibbosa]
MATGRLHSNPTAYACATMAVTSVVRLLSLLLFVANCAVLIAWHVHVPPPFTRKRAVKEYTYYGDDYPFAWPLPPLQTAHLAHEDSFHYDLDTDLGIAEWNATLPRGGAVLHLGPKRSPFTLSLFHQLRCLNIVRDVVVQVHQDPISAATRRSSRLVEHCMNYLRQTVVCRGDLRLETVRAYPSTKVTVSDVTHTCKDWSAVYKAAEDNYDDYVGNVSGLSS